MKDEHMDRALSVAEKLATMMVDARRDADSRDWERLSAEHAELTACIGDIAALIPEDCRSSKAEKLANVRNSVGLLAQRVEKAQADCMQQKQWAADAIARVSKAEADARMWNERFLAEQKLSMALCARRDTKPDLTPGTGAWAWQQMQRGPEVWVCKHDLPVTSRYHMKHPGLIENALCSQFNGVDPMVLEKMWPGSTDWELCDAPKQVDGSGPTRERQPTATSYRLPWRVDGSDVVDADDQVVATCCEDTEHEVNAIAAGIAEQANIAFSTLSPPGLTPELFARASAGVFNWDALGLPMQGALQRLVTYAWQAGRVGHESRSFEVNGSSGPTREQVSALYGYYLESSLDGLPVAEQRRVWRFTYAIWTAAREGMVPVGCGCEGTDEAFAQLETKLKQAEARVRELEDSIDQERLAVRLALTAAGVPESEAYPEDPTIDERERSLRTGGRILKPYDRVRRLHQERDQLRADLAAEKDTVSVTHGQLQQSRATVTQLQSDLAALRGEEFTREWCAKVYGETRPSGWQSWVDMSESAHTHYLRFANACRVRTKVCAYCGNRLAEDAKRCAQCISAPNAFPSPGPQPAPTPRGRKLTDGERSKLDSLIFDARHATTANAIARASLAFQSFVEPLLAPAPEPNRANEAIAAELSNWRTWGGIHSLMGLDDESARKHIAARLQPAPPPPPSELPTEEMERKQFTLWDELTLAENNKLSELFLAAGKGDDSDAWCALCAYVSSLRSAAVSAVLTELGVAKTRIIELEGVAKSFELAMDALGQIENMFDSDQELEPPEVVALVHKQLTTLRARVVLPMSEAQREELATLLYDQRSAPEEKHKSPAFKDCNPVYRACFHRMVDALAPRIARVGIRELSASEIHKAFEDARTYPSNSEGDALTGLNLTRFAANILAKATGGAS